MPEVNYIAVGVATAAAFVLGGLWYSPVLFGNRWAALSGQSEEQLKSGSMALIFAGAFLLTLISAGVLAMFIGPMDLKFATAAGLSAGLCWVAASLGVVYLFERRPLGLWLINGGFLVVEFTMMGAIIGAFN